MGAPILHYVRRENKVLFAGTPGPAPATPGSVANAGGSRSLTCATGPDWCGGRAPDGGTAGRQRYL